MSSTLASIALLIADDDDAVRATLVKQFGESPGIVVVGMGGDADSAIRVAEATQPDVALVDFHMPGGGEQTVRGILAVSPGTKVIALSGSTDPEATRAMLRAGAGSYLVKGSSPDDMIDAVVRSARGESIIAAEVAEEVLGEFASHLERRRVSADELRRQRDRIDLVLERKLVKPVFQPIVELETGRVAWYEALSRFPSDPALSPAQWFADAETVDRRAELELLAAKLAITAFRAHRGLEGLAINVSPGAIGDVAQLGGWLGSRLLIEVTEHAAIEDYRAVTVAMSPSRATGVRLAVDDAGAGFASLRHVLELKPDVVKLDVSLTRNIDHDPSRCALARGLIGFAKELRIEIVAEGIETAAELATLRELGVGLGQGFLLGRPLPLPR
jgi:EAL domain-containing protein (putative c-di-GMP-specific phosphodiesterase class I)/AmiR/NasT family two-component response regulator